MKLRGFVFLAVAFTLLFAQTGLAQEDVSKFPSHPITYVCPVPPGTSVDLSTRLIAKELEKILGQPVVVVNKPGAALTVGTAAVAKAAPDGYTIGFTGGPPLYFTPFLQKLPYDPMKDLRMVSQYGGFNVGVCVKKDSPFKSFKEIVEYARKNPGKVTYGTTGTNSITHITMERIAEQEGVKMTHIPFKGTPKVQAAVLGGHIQFGCGGFSAALAGGADLRLLMLLREEKSPQFPDAPILKELGYNVPYPMLNAIITAKAVPDPIVQKLDDAVAQAMKSPELLKAFEDMRVPLSYHGHKEMDAYIQEMYEYFAKELEKLGLRKY